MEQSVLRVGSTGVKTMVKKIRKEGSKYYTYEIQETELLPERPVGYGMGVDDKQRQFPRYPL